LITPIISIAIYALIFAFIRSQTYNLIYQNTSVGSNKLRARMDTKSLASLYITNTLGADRTAMQVDKNLDEFITNAEKEQAAFGEEFGDVFDIDVAI